MKKLFVLFMIVVLVCSSLCACSGQTGTYGKNDNAGQNAGAQQNTGGNASSGSGGLQLLSNRYGESACNTENGYYYLTTETKKLRDGSYGTHLMYMDFAAGREIYLCSTAGCKHDSLDCPAVFSYDDFPVSSTIPFVFGDHLYILSREYDGDGSVSQGTITIGGDGSSVESQPAVLYRANLDGTNREKIFTFDAALTLEDKIVGNDKGIYVITKKLSADKDGNQTYTTSSERKLMFLDLNTLSLSEICSMDFGDHISWQIIDCSPNDFLLCGVDFGREVSRDEIWDEDLHKEIYKNSLSHRLVLLFYYNVLIRFVVQTQTIFSVVTFALLSKIFIKYAAPYQNLFSDLIHSSGLMCHPCNFLAMIHLTKRISFSNFKRM